MRRLNTAMTGAIAAGFAVLIGCGAPQAGAPLAGADADGSAYLLAEEPDGAMGVIQAREAAHDGDPIVLVGRIGGATNPWVEGRAAFTLLDPSMLVVDESQGMGEGQLCTGDCCATERQACTTLVKVVDPQGQLVAVDARKLLGLKEADMVVVSGTAKKDELGNFQLLATGVHVRR
ncbi:hypothetical protein Pla175_25760 [Pirellulimonas nuda]|uniref:DUF5666 domain-containing protein n=1 Tax=Pirellulimonas nuda TaxID=2528009 RepID=A0A518DCJ1_9BACT|nr:hypothetical protein [Pirellulimonas nuda]QDU89189.1 hypothetical protein Pla175_25760 [Pirellulimonas nuda]